jgi:serine phosphatase RsbU (regulator of sigma subunit)
VPPGRADPSPGHGDATGAAAGDALSEVLEDLALLACRGVSGCDAAGVTVRLPGSGPVAAASGTAARAIDRCQSATDAGPCLTSLREGVVVEVEDYAQDRRWPQVSSAALSVGTHSSLSLPLRDGSRTVGVLNLYGTRVGPFGAEAHRTARALARQASGTIRSLELLEEERQWRRSEQRIAERLQRSLLPTVPALPGMTCATRYLVAADSASVGGDWYDAFRLPDGAVGVAIGDVQGHDIAAAAAMAQLRSVLRSYAYEGISPSAVIDRLDRLVQGFSMAQVATAVYGRLVHDWDGALFLFCNAGHPPPLVKLPEGDAIRLTGAASRRIGAPRATPSLRSEAAVVLPSGSTLLLYTDGLVQRQGSDLDEGVETLRRTLSACPGDSGPEVLCDAVASAGGDYDDDVALLALHIE